MYWMGNYIGSLWLESKLWSFNARTIQGLKRNTFLSPQDPSLIVEFTFQMFKAKSQTKSNNNKTKTLPPTQVDLSCWLYELQDIQSCYAEKPYLKKPEKSVNMGNKILIYKQDVGRTKWRHRCAYIKPRRSTHRSRLQSTAGVQVCKTLRNSKPHLISFKGNLS